MLGGQAHSSVICLLRCRSKSRQNMHDLEMNYYSLSHEMQNYPGYRYAFLGVTGMP